MADAWGGSWGTSWANSWGGAGSTPTVTVTPAVGHGRRRRRVIIDDVIYEGTDDQIEAKLWEILQAREEQQPKKVVKQAKQQAKKARKPVELKRDYVPIPVAVDLPKFEQLVADTYRHEDALTRALLQKMWQRYLEDEDDAEVILLAV